MSGVTATLYSLDTETLLSSESLDIIEQRPAILFVTHRVPYPPDKGDRIRTYHWLRYLSRRCRVYLASLADEPVPESTVACLNELCERVTIVPIGGVSRLWHGLTSLAVGGAISEGMFYSPRLMRTVNDWCNEIDFHAGLASASSVAMYLNPLIRLGARTLVDLVDVDSEKWREYAEKSAFPKSSLYSLEANRLRRVERSICERVQEVTLVSPGEVTLFSERVFPARARTVTNGVDLNYFSPIPVREENQGCVFVGAMDYRPNVDAVVWFAREIWPAIRGTFPEQVFRIVGRNPAREVQHLTSIAGVEVIGTVPDVRQYVTSSAISVAPLRIARGLQNKVLESLAMGRPVVASPQALAGFSEEVPAVLARSPEEWKNRLVDLLSNLSERQSLGLRGRRFAEMNHDWDRCLQPLSSLLALGERRDLVSSSR